MRINLGSLSSSSSASTIATRNITTTTKATFRFLSTYTTAVNTNISSSSGSGSNSRLELGLSLKHKSCRPIFKSHLAIPSRAFFSGTRLTRRTMATKAVFSSGYDAVEGERQLLSLVKRESGGGNAVEEEEEKKGRWRLVAGGMGVERSFRFKSFKKTWEFMNVIAAECAVKKHHPEWSNVYNTTFIRWTTHSPPGLSEKDILMARFCDEQAAVFGEVVPPPETESVEIEGGEGGGLKGEGEEGGREEVRDVGKELADRVAREGGECCVPKSLRKKAGGGVE